MDVRGQVGMTQQLASKGTIRAFAKQTADANVRITQVRLIGKDFDITIKYDPSK